MDTASRERADAVEVRAIREAFRRGVPLSAHEDDVHLVMDGARPFLVVIRDARAEDPITHLVKGEAAYLRAGPEADRAAVVEMIRAVARAGVETHGSFLLIEVWAGAEHRIFAPDGPAASTVSVLAEGLESIEHRGTADSRVDIQPSERRHPPGQEPLFDVSTLHEMGTLLLGVELAESWRDDEDEELYPVYLRRLAHDISRVIRNAAFEFLRVQTGTELPSYRALGRRTLGQPVWEADRALSEIDSAFDELLLVAPVNEDAAWERFRDSGFERAPAFHYRLLPIEPDLLKRRLYEVRLEDVDDPAAWKLLHDKREELDRQISLLTDRNTDDFLHSAIRLFGPVDAALRDRAHAILDEVSIPSSRAPGDPLGAAGFAELARREYDHYRRIYPDFRSEAQIRPDLVGLMVSSGRLLIGDGLRLPPDRVEALLQHEVGTHVLTYVNGAAQPFLQLARGFADYDETQEGLGVLAEYLVGGLTAPRMRLLAARVVAVDSRIQGADFVETFRRLHHDHGFTARTSFDITARVHASGGFTRDHIYLRGLTRVVEYLRDGGPLEPLYVGKIALRHLDVVDELRERGVLEPVPLMPRFLDRPEARDRLAALRDGLPIHRMVSSTDSGQ